MMYGFGDCRRPLAETAGLIEEIVYRQMVDILYKAEEIGRERGSRFLGIEEFLFLLRRDKMKLKRLLHFLEFKDVKMAPVKCLDDDDLTETVSVADARLAMKKRMKICYNFLSAIDQKGDLIALFEDSTEDEVRTQRKMRAELQSRNMEADEYMEFCEARQASFTSHCKMQKFRDWLLSDVTLEIKPGPLAMEILSYLAFESVAQIVDFALIVKKDMNVRADNPLTVEMAWQCTNLDAFTASTSGSASTLASTTSTSSANGSPPLPNSGGFADPNTAAGRMKAKKRKMLGANMSRELITGGAISPTEVREALRRFLQPSGPFACFSKEPVLSINHRHLAC